MVVIATQQQRDVMTDKAGGHLNTEAQGSAYHAISFFLIKIIRPLADCGLRNSQSPREIALSSAKETDCFRLTHDH